MIKKYLYFYNNKNYEDKTQINLVIASLLTFTLHFPLFVYFKYYETPSIRINNINKEIGIYLKKSEARTIKNEIDTYTENYQYKQPYYDTDSLDELPKMATKLVFASTAIASSSGTILRIKLWVNATGSVDDYEIIESTMIQSESKKIINKIKNARFFPGKKNGINVPTILFGEFEEQ